MSEPKKKIGLLAGWGDFPIHVARSLSAQGYAVYGLGIKGHASEELASCCHDFRWFGLGKMGAQVRYLQRNNVEIATMAGKIFKTIIFRKFHLLRHLPDLMFWRHFYPVFITRAKDRRDDTLLTTVTQLYAAGGVTFAPATDFAPELLVNEGILTKKRPSSAQQKDIEFGWQMAKEMGRLDIGQSIVVKNLAVLAVEAVEGTDQCIQRAGQLCPSGGFTVVKVAKPQQDMRFDVPTIGEGTIRTIHENGGRVLAIEAGKTILLDGEKTIQLAGRLGISIIAIDESKLQKRVAA